MNLRRAFSLLFAHAACSTLLMHQTLLSISYWRSVPLGSGFGLGIYFSAIFEAAGSDGDAALGFGLTVLVLPSLPMVLVNWGISPVRSCSLRITATVL